MPSGMQCDSNSVHSNVIGKSHSVTEVGQIHAYKEVGVFSKSGFVRPIEVVL